MRKEAPADAPSPGGSGTTVLIVDDEQSVRQTYNAVLTDLGCLVETAGSGHQALQILMQRSFDALVVDIRMQGMNGIVFLQEALRIWPEMGVVVVSGYLNEEVLREAKKLGVRHIMQKPIERERFCTTVMGEAAARRRPAGEAAGEAPVALMRDHLRLLTHLVGRSATETLTTTLRDFGVALKRMMPAAALGVLVVKDDEHAMLLLPLAPVKQRFLLALQESMLARFESLSGTVPDRAVINVLTEGTPSEEGAAEPTALASVPVILSDKVAGMLTFASAGPRQYEPGEVSLLYHAANHVSTIFTAIQQMHRLTAQDPLTGVYNRIRLQEELDRAWRVSRRYDSAMAVVIVDVDSFKTMNDAYGHTVGDEILREFARVLETVARTSDVIARYGGDEFVAILPRAEESDARAFGERLLNSTREHLFCPRTHRLRATISVGIASSRNPTAPATGTALLSQADRALYMAKRAGRNRMCTWPGRPREIGTPEPAAPAPPAEAEVDRASVGRIVVVDDEPAVRNVVGLLLQKEGYETVSFGTANEALEAIRARPRHFDLLLTDLSLPVTSGIELLHQLADNTSLVKIVMTGYATVTNAVSCLREGAYDFIQKPIDQEQLLAMLRRAMEYRRLKVQNALYQSHLEEMVHERSAQLANSFEEIKRSYEFTLEALVAMLDAREHRTGRHSQRVRDLAVTLAREMGVEGEALENVATGALLHDIGKIAIPDAVLFRPGPLSPDEWKIMKQHSEIGYRILSSSPFLRDAAEMVYAHQEHYDGSGYPRGLAGADICIGARIFAIVDAYDAMRSERVYRGAVSPEQAAEEIRKNSGTQFDPDAVQAFLKCQIEIERLLQISRGKDEAPASGAQGR
jgi:diguanylate cyclase (GGDEF)-like protein/putative nucleotidyltransferase with HDIG domain